MVTHRGGATVGFHNIRDLPATLKTNVDEATLKNVHQIVSSFPQTRRVAATLAL